MFRSSRSSKLLPVLLLALIFPACRAEPVLVDDQAALLSDEQRDRITRHHAYLLEDFDIDYRLITVRAAGDIVGFSAERFRELNIGGLSESGRGFVLVIDAVEDQVRLEVGHALEGVYADAFVAYIEQRQMVPFFRANRVADGILATTELIVAQAQDALARNGLDMASGVSGSAGAGATARAQIGEAPAPAERDAGPDRTAGSSPAQTLSAYFQAMRVRDNRKETDLYSAATQRMLQDWVMTPAQMDNVIRTYRSCNPETAKIDPRGLHAVIRYPASERRCSPWFFVHEQARWKLDFTVMQQAIRFGRDNSWRFGTNVPDAYAFAFDDWKFDQHGFPIAR